MRLELKESFNLIISADCGQAFRFRTDEKGNTVGVAGNKAFKGRVENGFLITETPETDDEFWKNYFDLNSSYLKMNESILKRGDETVKKAITLAEGLHIFNQEPFETLISFIISQNNNIPRIRGIIERLCELYGEEIGEGLHSFPTPEALKGITAEELSPLKAGFRAKYIADAVRCVNEGKIKLEGLKTKSFEEAKEELKTVKGIGDKVASCVLLFGFHKLEAFPVDVWIKRTMESLYGDLDYSRFGEYPGLAQQYLFYYSRYLKSIKEN